MIEQRTTEWMDARRGKVTASRVADVMRGDKFASWKNYRAELVLQRLTNTDPENFTSREMQYGIDTEPLARLHYALKTRNKVEECGFFEHEELMVGASPDGTIGKDGLIEIKCRNTANHIETLHSGQIPKMYYAQVQTQLWITGRKWADYISFDPRLPTNAQMIIIPVPRDDIYIEKLEREVTRFLQEVDEQVEFITNYGKG